METEALTNFIEAEEGEILDDEDPEELYVPLKRPHIPVAGNAEPLPPSESDDDAALKESSSDSDSSVKKLNPSKMRKKILPLKPKTLTVKKKNYNIWCSDLQTEVLTNSLVDCSVDQSIDRCRDVESYNYRLGMHNNDNKKLKESFLNSKNHSKKCFSGKRRHDGANVGEKTKIKEPDGPKKWESELINARNILPLTTTVKDSNEDMAKDIANKLCEEKEDLIFSALNIIGKKDVICLFEETREIEKAGGMLVMNGTRRRTPGGVFFYLLKSSATIPRDKINSVLMGDKKTRAEEKKITAKKMRQIQAAKFKQALSKDDFPTLLSRTELAIKEFKARKLAEDTGEVKNPPPSPATDGKECSSEGEEQKESAGHSERFSHERRSLTTYDENLFEDEDTMEVA